MLTSQTFDPYGTPYSEMGAEQSAFGFTGEQTDENGLVYLRARYYNPAQGRFMQVDPSRMERNGYQYAGSSPGMYADPSGNCVDMGELLAFLSPLPGPRPSLANMWGECKKNWSTFWNVASNPSNDFNNTAYSFSYYVNPLGIQVRNTWAGLAELSAANSRWVGAGGYGQWLGKIELFGIAPGRWLGWGADTSSYYQDAEHPYRYVEDLGTIFVPTYGAGLTVAFAAQGSMAQAQRNALAEAQANANVARQWAYLNEYYPSSAIGTAAPGTLSRLVNAFASQRAANAMMAMPEYQVPLGGDPVYNLLGTSGPQAPNFAFTSRNELLARGQPPFEKIHWIPRQYHPLVRQLYGRALDPFLNSTEPLERTFHQYVHGMGGTRADSYNPYVKDWLIAAQSNGATPLDFLQFINATRLYYLELYAEYLTIGG